MTDMHDLYVELQGVESEIDSLELEVSAYERAFEPVPMNCAALLAEAYEAKRRLEQRIQEGGHDFGC